MDLFKSIDDLSKAIQGRHPETGRWVTLNGGTSNETGEHHGVHVFINDSGQITKGPKALVDKSAAQAKEHAAHLDKARSLAKNHMSTPEWLSHIHENHKDVFNTVMKHTGKDPKKIADLFNEGKGRASAPKGPRPKPTAANTRYHVTAAHDKILEQGFQPNKGNGIGGNGNQADHVYTTQDGKYARSMADHYNALERIRTSKDPWGELERYAGEHGKKRAEARWPMHEDEIGRKLTEGEKAMLGAISGPKEAPFLHAATPGMSFLRGNEKPREWKTLGVDVSQGKKYGESDRFNGEEVWNHESVHPFELDEPPERAKQPYEMSSKDYKAANPNMHPETQRLNWLNSVIQHVKGGGHIPQHVHDAEPWLKPYIDNGFKHPRPPREKLAGEGMPFKKEQSERNSEFLTRASAAFFLMTQEHQVKEMRKILHKQGYDAALKYIAENGRHADNKKLMNHLKQLAEADKAKGNGLAPGQEAPKPAEKPETKPKAKAAGEKPLNGTDSGKTAQRHAKNIIGVAMKHFGEYDHEEHPEANLPSGHDGYSKAIKAIMTSKGFTKDAEKGLKARGEFVSAGGLDPKDDTDKERLRDYAHDLLQAELDRWEGKEDQLKKSFNEDYIFKSLDRLSFYNR